MPEGQDSDPGHREFIAECLGMLRIHAGLGARYAEIGDDVGLSHAMRRIMAYVRAAQETFAELLKNSPKKPE
jgi:hypothetical protein